MIGKGMSGRLDLVANWLSWNKSCISQPRRWPMIDDMGENEHTGALAAYIVITILVVIWSAVCGGLFYVVNHLRF